MSKYIVTVKPGEECNPEYAPDKDLQEGMGIDGYILIGFKNEKPYLESMMGVSVSHISKWIRRKTQGANNIRKACAIAEGELKAMEIDEEEHAGEITLEAKGPTLNREMIERIFGRKEQ